ncbi:MAG: glycoside hydrolase family 31 protein, partial [Clostridia bacterium]|nr:glycoside hydrolase family 31 protein [Clostridia bacterium]
RGTIEDIWVRHAFWRCDVYCPFYISTKGYGLYLNSAFHSMFDMGYSIPDAALLYTYSNIIDLFYIDGPAPQDIVSSFTGIIGRSPMPPKWAFGFWQAGFNICKGRDIATDALNRYNEENIPVDVFCFDPAYATNRSDMIWSDERFPNHEEYLKLLEDNDMHQILWICPFAVPDTEVLKTGKEKGMFMVDKDGNFLRSHNWVGKGSGLLDFDAPETRKWLTNGLSNFLNEGVAGFKLDGGDTFEVPERMFTNAGISAKEMHNVYPIMHAKTVQEIAKETKPDARPVTWQRTGFTGSGRYPITWGGDQLATFSGMQVLIKGGQGAGLCGVSFWSQDIGGFSWHPETDEELFIRSYQWGVLSPLARAHGRKTEPWSWTEQGLKITGDFIKLRYKLMPYIYSCAYKSHKTGVPFMYPLFFYDMKDANTYPADYQYGYGPAFMIAPIYEKAGNEERTAAREIYLPDGEWIDFNTKEVLKGGQHITYTAKIDELPLFIKKGAIIPQATEVARIAKMDFNRLTVEIYPDATATSFDWYNDEGNNFDYQKDINNIVTFSTVNDGKIKIDIAAKNAAYQPDYVGKFILKVFCDKPNTVTVNGTTAEFTYDGKFAEIKVTYDINETLNVVVE